jgi:hypothetical protein
VVPGSYTLELTGSITGNGQEGARGHVPLAEQQVDVGANDLTDVALSVNPPVQATGTITIDGPANGSSLSRLRVIARPLSDVTHSNFGFANVANDGTFVLRNLNRERYVINLLTGGTGLYVKSLDLGGQDILYKQTDLSQVSDPQIHAVVRLGAGEISGRVQDPSSTGSGTPIRAAVALVPQTLAPDASNVVFTYARGSGFAFSGIAPGTYLLFAAEFADPNIWQNPDFLQQIGSVGSAVTVTENGHTSTQLDRLSLEQVDSAAQRAGLGSP